MISETLKILKVCFLTKLIIFIIFITSLNPASGLELQAMTHVQKKLRRPISLLSLNATLSSLKIEDVNRDSTPLPLAPGCDSKCVGVVGHHKVIFLVDNNNNPNDAIPMLENYAALKDVCTSRGAELIHIKNAEYIRKRLYPLVKALKYVKPAGQRGGVPLAYEFNSGSLDGSAVYGALDTGVAGNQTNPFLTPILNDLKESVSKHYPPWSVPQSFLPDVVGTFSARKRCLGITGGENSLGVWQCLKPGLENTGVSINGVLCEASRRPIIKLPGRRGCDQRCGSAAVFNTPKKRLMYFLVNRNTGVKCNGCEGSEDLFDDQGKQVTGVDQMREICLRRGGDLVNAITTEIITEALYPMINAGGSSPKFEFHKKMGIPLAFKPDPKQARYSSLQDDNQFVDEAVEGLPSDWTKPCAFKEDSSSCVGKGSDRCMGFGCVESSCSQGLGIAAWDCEKREAGGMPFTTAGVLCEKSNLKCDEHCVGLLKLQSGRTMFLVDDDMDTTNALHFMDVHGERREVLTYMQLRIQCLERGGDLINLDSVGVVKDELLPMILAAGYDGGSQIGILLGFDVERSNSFVSLRTLEAINGFLKTLETEEGWESNIKDVEKVNTRQCVGLKFDDKDEPILASWPCTFSKNEPNKKMEAWTRVAICEKLA